MVLSPEQAEQIRQKLLEQIERLPEEQREQREQKEQLRLQILNASAEQLEAVIKQGAHEKEIECLFCSIAKGDVETVKVYEDDSIVAFLDINPAAAGQTIVIPKEHSQFIFQLPDQVLWNLIKIIKLLEPLIVNATKAGGISIYISQGSAAGQYFPHLSINLIPRFEGDKAAFYWERKEAAKDDLEKVAAAIREGVSKMIKEEKEKIERVVKERSKAVSVSEQKEEKLEEFPRRRM